MIKKIKNIEITGGKAPYFYTWESVHPCVSFSEIEGTTNQFINTEISFSSEWCLTNANITLNVRDSEGCIREVAISIEDTCSTFTLPNINRTDNINSYTFTCFPTTGTSPYSYLWSWDTSQYSLIQGTSNTDSSITLVRNEGVNPSSSFINVTVQDSEGCVEYKSYAFVQCNPVAGNASLTVSCGSTNTYANKTFNFNEILSICNSINWRSLVVDLPSGISMNQTNGIAVFTFSNSLEQGSMHSATWYVEDIYGNVSNTGIITFSMPTCNVSEYIIASNEYIKMPVGVTTTSYYYPINNSTTQRVISTNPVDWDSFVFNALNGQSVSETGKQLTITGVGNITLTYDGQLKFQVTTVPSPAQTINAQWRVKDSEGNWSNTSNWIFDFNTYSTPSASNITFCAECGEATPFIDIVQNSGVPINRSTLTIVSPPSYGSVSITDNGYAAYSLDASNSASSDSFTFNFKNTDNVTSNTATATINRYCAGVSPGPIDVSCWASKTFNLNDQLTGLKSSGSWTEIANANGETPYTTGGGVITGGNSGAITLTSANTYRFRKTVSAGSGVNCPVTNTVDLEIINNSVPAALGNTCGSAINMTYISTAYPSSILNNQTNASSCPNYLAPTDSGVAKPASWNSTCSGDVWYTFNTGSSSYLTPTIQMYGVNHPQIALYSGSCGSLSLVTHAATTNTDVTISPTLSASTQYWIRVTTGTNNNAGTYSVAIANAPVV